MNITKAIATEVAAKLLKKQSLEIKSLKDELTVKFTEIYSKELPKEVLDLFSKHPDYFEARRQMQVTGNGFSYQYINLQFPMPSKRSCFSPNEKDAKILMTYLNKINDKKAGYNKLFSELEIALFGLRTYKRVEENFPEAFLLLPNKTTTAIALNISDLRQKIK